MPQWTPWGHLLALKITAANEQERAQVDDLIADVQEVTDEQVEIAFVDYGYTVEQPVFDAEKHGVNLCAVEIGKAKRGFVLLPRRWVVERSFAWASDFWRLARDYERIPSTVAVLNCSLPSLLCSIPFSQKSVTATVFRSEFGLHSIISAKAVCLEIIIGFILIRHEAI